MNTHITVIDSYNRREDWEAEGYTKVYRYTKCPANIPGAATDLCEIMEVFGNPVQARVGEDGLEYEEFGNYDWSAWYGEGTQIDAILKSGGKEPVYALQFPTPTQYLHDMYRTALSFEVCAIENETEDESGLNVWESRKHDD